MRDTERNKMMKNGLEAYESLNKCVYDAGGSGFSAEQLDEMSALDLIFLLSTNRIRFMYLGKVRSKIKKHRQEKIDFPEKKND